PALLRGSLTAGCSERRRPGQVEPCPPAACGGESGVLGQIIDRLMAVLPQFVVWLGTFPAVYAVFAWVEERTSAEAKRDIALWLRNFGGKTIEGAVSLNVRQFHEKLFAQKQFSLDCVIRTSLWSLLSYIMILIFLIYSKVIAIRGIQDTENSLAEEIITFVGLDDLLSYFFFVIVPLDFIGVGATRILINLIGKRMSLVIGTLLVFIDIKIKNNNPSIFC
ncbi:MAG TPA: hypothetical protein VK963_03940, partial [Candidatus Saccharimonadales bacterium]|nr:hypothetical protein [Candidatus Saccharimonadales bacterium]